MYFPTLDLFLLTSSLENMYFIALRKSSYYYYLKKKKSSCMSSKNYSRDPGNIY